MGSAAESGDSGRRALGKLRQGIDAVDRAIVKLLDRRVDLAVKTASLKEQLDLPLFQPWREAEVLERVSRESRRFPKPSLQAIYREMMGASLALERRFRVAVLGPETTYSHLAAIQHFGRSVELTFQPTIADVFTAVAKEEADVGVVPIENSTDGAIVHTLDNLVDSPLSIAAEILLPIRHQLLVHPDVLKRARPRLLRIASKAEPLAQCRNYLEAHHSGVPLRETPSTAAAAIEAHRRPGVAAIASELAAERYGLAVMASGIEDMAGNTTRFLVLRREGVPRPPAHYRGSVKTSIAFSMKDKPGALYTMLESFKKFGINLTKIESRPSRVKAWRYFFFLDMEGHADEPRIRRALQDLGAHCAFLRVLGSYPGTAPVAGTPPVKSPSRRRRR